MDEIYVCFIYRFLLYFLFSSRIKGLKMKKAVVLITVMFLAAGCARLQVVPDQERMIRSVYSLNLAKEKIYGKSLEWMVKKFVSARDSIDIRDDKNFRLVGRGSGYYSEYFDFLVDRRFSYTMTIEIKDGRYRVTYDNLYLYYEERVVQYVPAKYRHELESIKKALDAQMKDLYGFVTTDGRPAEKKDENW